MRSRSGSAILLCLALSTIAVIVGYAFLRAATRQEMSGRTEMMIALARDAAQSGMTHATEQILADYTAGSLTIADASGTKTITPPTFLDGPYRAPFVSFTKPNILAGTQTGDPIEEDDVQEENHLLMPLIRKSGGYDGAYGWHSDLGCNIYDGRGRYIEVNYYNVARPSPAAAAPEPVAPIRFTDLAAAVPARADGLFLDENLHRLTSGIPATDRTKARYRVRYAVGVEDLEGHLLSNPIADMDADWKNPTNDYRGYEMVNPSTGAATTTAPAIVRPKTPWLETAANVWNNMAACYLSYSKSAPLRLEHVFRGRGSTCNTDRCASGTRQGLPSSFPMMFRCKPGYGGHWAFTLYGSGDGGGWSLPQPENWTGRLYQWNPSRPWYPAIAANPMGGEIITTNDQGPTFPRAHALVGPQASWFTQYAAMMGQIAPGDGGDGDGKWEGGFFWGSRRGSLLTLSTPFGRRLQASAAAPANRKWYEGQVDTPWHVNLLTAAPQVISEMLIAYLPPHLKTLHYARDDFYPKIGVNADGYNIYGPLSFSETNGGAGWDVQIPGRDIVTSLAAAGFSEFPAPTSNFGSAAPFIVLNPDYYQDLWETRPVTDRYPGPLMRGDSSIVNEGSDDLGKEIDVDSRAIGRCTHTGHPLLFLYGGDFSYGTTRGATDYLVWRRIDPLKFTYKYSYYWDLVKAMTTALSYARATWVQYPNTVFDPLSSGTNPGFTPASLRDPTAYDTLEEIDRLFLRQLGENFDAPGTPCPDHPILVNGPTSGKYNFSIDPNPVSNTIQSLVSNNRIATAAGVASAERGKVMERLLNDFRMSFLGASPGYSESFRPMDFDGDGKVMCSCYDSNTTAATANEVLYKTTRWKTASAGVGPALTTLSITDPASNVSPSPWFSVTGCFSIRKSHFYRIFTRGEVYDTYIRKPVSAQTLESVVVVDPEAPAVMPAGRNPMQTRTLYQRWHYNDSTSELPRHLR